jgi:hypothetical protein
MGEARRKRLQVSTKSTETRSSPRRLRNSRCLSSILNGAGAASSSALEQRLLPLLHTLNGRGCTRGTITIVHGIAAPRIVGRHDTFYCVVWWSAQTGRQP